jgi:hypothetical protein
MSEMKVLMKSIMISPSLLDEMALRTKRRYITHLSEVFNVSRMDLENAWDLLQTTYRPGKIPGLLHAICQIFIGRAFSVDQIAEAMVLQGGSVEA